MAFLDMVLSRTLWWTPHLHRSLCFFCLHPNCEVSSSNLLDNGGPPTPTVLVDKQSTEVNVFLKSYTFLNSQCSCNNVVPLLHVGRRTPLISEIMNIHHDPGVIHCLIEPCVVCCCQVWHIPYAKIYYCIWGVPKVLLAPRAWAERSRAQTPDQVELWHCSLCFQKSLDSSQHIFRILLLKTNQRFYLGLFFLEIWLSNISTNTVERSTANIYRDLWCKHQVNTGWQADCIIHILQNSLICMSFTRKSLWSSIVQVIQVTWTHHTHTHALISKVKMTRREKLRENITWKRIQVDSARTRKLPPAVISNDESSFEGKCPISADRKRRRDSVGARRYGDNEPKSPS